ncbi:MAG: ABC transporter ATP-binding protein/permease [Lachnospiraceae bacterium]|nr:ABC transporter ATP-binding protein/permease [Ruminococcus sp.]MCM1276637.1 ABC transporter ATP-binding protein/permease [Lachnospiraceae bacterium]
MGTILSKVKLNKKYIVMLLIFMLIASVAEMMLPTLLANMIDDGVGGENKGVIFTLAVIMAVMAVLACIANIAATKLSAMISTKFAADVRREIFYRVQSFSASEMDKFGTASLVTRSTSDVTNVQMFLTMLLRLGVMAPLMAVAGLVLSSATGGKVSSVLNVAIPILIISSGIIILLVSRYSVKMRRMIDRINKLFLETLEGVRVIRAFNKQEHEIKRFGEANAEYSKTAVISGRINGLLMPVIQIIFGVTTVAVMVLGSFYVSEGEMEVGALVANSQYISMILASIILLAAVIMMFPMSYACAKRIAEVLNTENSIHSGNKTISEGKKRGSVEFRGVTFSYPNADEPVLSDITFEAHSGEITAIIGRTGCGKSSVLKLIPRLYDPTVGHILVNGIDIKKYNIRELRDLIGYVPQKNVLFSGDIASNLNFGNENGTESDWEKAAEISCAKEFIEKKDGTYHSEIAQGGTNLSGGQRQRMAIARAVMKKPEIYIFDDSFSALDMKTDKELRGNIKRNMGNATVIMVAQRISSIIDADRILVLENGKIVGNGTHKELLQNCELYREIAVLQLGEEAVENEI